MPTDEELKLRLLAIIGEMNGYADANRIRPDLKQKNGKRRFAATIIQSDGTEIEIVTPWKK